MTYQLACALLLVSCAPALHAGEAVQGGLGTSARGGVEAAFASFPGGGPAGRIEPLELRDFLAHLREHFSGAPESSFARGQHANKLLHALRDRGGGLHTAATLKEITDALGEVKEAYEAHAAGGEAGGQEGACDGIPTRIMDRSGTCELKMIRYGLEQSRAGSPLFDTGRWVQNWERGLAMMWEIHQAGLGPMHVVVKPAL